MFKTQARGPCLTCFNLNRNTTTFRLSITVVQESYVVQDPPAPPSDTLSLPPLTSLYSDNTHNKELPQHWQGESRPVLPPTQRSLSRQIMKAWAPWSEVIASSQNSRMLDQLTLRTPLTIAATKEQDLDPRPSSNIDVRLFWTMR